QASEQYILSERPLPASRANHLRHCTHVPKSFPSIHKKNSAKSASSRVDGRMQSFGEALNGSFFRSKLTLSFFSTLVISLLKSPVTVAFCQSLTSWCIRAITLAHSRITRPHWHSNGGCIAPGGMSSVRGP